VCKLDPSVVCECLSWSGIGCSVLCWVIDIRLIKCLNDIKVSAWNSAFVGECYLFFKFYQDLKLSNSLKLISYMLIMKV
jgi:hypothetical protein